MTQNHHDRHMDADATLLSNVSNRTVFVWLIENMDLGGPTPRWWHDQSGWVWDANDAMQFCRRQDCRSTYCFWVIFTRNACCRAWLYSKTGPSPMTQTHHDRHTDADATQGGARQEAELHASSRCPLCGVDTPHHHTEKEQAELRGCWEAFQAGWLRNPPWYSDSGDDARWQVFKSGWVAARRNVALAFATERQANDAGRDHGEVA